MREALGALTEQRPLRRPVGTSGSAVTRANSSPAALNCASAGRVIAGAARIPRTLSPVKRRTLVT